MPLDGLGLDIGPSNMALQFFLWFPFLPRASKSGNTTRMNRKSSGPNGCYRGLTGSLEREPGFRDKWVFLFVLLDPLWGGVEGKSKEDHQSLFGTCKCQSPSPGGVCCILTAFPFQQLAFLGKMRMVPTSWWDLGFLQVP